MNRLIIWMIVFGTLCAVFVAGLFGSASLLPERVASHFNAAGQPDGWMAKTTYLWFTLATGLGVPLLMPVLFFVTRFFPDWTINLPNKAYWLSPERRPATQEFVAVQGVIMGSLLLLFFGALHTLTVLANRSDPVRLSGVGMAVALGLFLAAMGLWILFFLRRFR